MLHAHTGIAHSFLSTSLDSQLHTISSASEFVDRSAIHLNSARMCAIEKREKWKKDKDETQEEY